MDNEKLLDEIEQWLDNHGYINGIGFSEHGLLERIREVRALNDVVAA